MNLQQDLEMKKEGFDGKVFNKLKRPIDIFSWRIKFPDDVPLKAVPEENFYITDRHNTLVDFELHIERRTNSVIVSPMDSYDNNVYYFLHIKKFDVGSALNSRKLPPIHVGFRVRNDNSLDLIWLKGRFDPKTVMQNAIPVVEKKATSLKQEYLNKMEFIHNTILVYPILLAGIVLSLLPQNESFSEVAILGTAALIVALCVAQLILYFLEKRGKKLQSVNQYNMGILSYNSGYYQNAEVHFDKSLTINPKNQSAEKALEINRRYLMKELSALQEGNIDLERRVFRYGKMLLFIAAICTGINALLNVILPTDSDTEVYFNIAIYCCIFFQLIFFLIQRHSAEKMSTDEYNKGIALFASKDWEKAVHHFTTAIKFDTFNRHAQNAKELVTLITINLERKQKLEEEAADNAAREARQNEVQPLV